MRQRLLLLLAALFVSPAVSTADEALHLSYRDVSGRVALTLGQDIHVGEHRSIAGRRISVDLAMDQGVGTTEATVERVRAGYTSHEMEQRLGARHILGRVISLTSDPSGRLLTLSTEQETEGETVLPQDGLGVRQITRVEIAPAT